MMKLVRTPLRISLLGGGSDIPSHYEKHGGAVLSFSIDKYIYLTSKNCGKNFTHNYRLVYSQIEECKQVDEIKHPIIRSLCQQYNIPTLDLDVMSDIPAGTGLGSSSAFTVGLHNVFSDSSDKHSLAEKACQTELIDLQEPIGKQDQYAAAFGGINVINFLKGGEVPVNPLLLTQHDLGIFKNHMYLTYVGGTRSASNQLKEQTHDPGLYELALEGGWSLLTRCYDELGDLIRQGWEMKKRASPNVSNERIDAIIDTALQHGATGGKLLGAGGCGFVLLFCPPKNRGKMLNGLRQFDLNFTPFNFDMEGSKVLYED